MDRKNIINPVAHAAQLTKADEMVAKKREELLEKDSKKKGVQAAITDEEKEIKGNFCMTVEGLGGREKMTVHAELRNYCNKNIKKKMILVKPLEQRKLQREQLLA